IYRPKSSTRIPSRTAVISKPHNIAKISLPSFRPLCGLAPSLSSPASSRGRCAVRPSLSSPAPSRGRGTTKWWRGWKRGSSPQTSPNPPRPPQGRFPPFPTPTNPNPVGVSDPTEPPVLWQRCVTEAHTRDGLVSPKPLGEGG